jgi:hypothetical protein
LKKKRIARFFWKPLRTEAVSEDLDVYMPRQDQLARLVLNAKVDAKTKDPINLKALNMHHYEVVKRHPDWLIYDSTNKCDNLNGAVVIVGRQDHQPHLGNTTS